MAKLQNDMIYNTTNGSIETANGERVAQLYLKDFENELDMDRMGNFLAMSTVFYAELKQATDLIEYLVNEDAISAGDWGDVINDLSGFQAVIAQVE